MAEIFNFIRFDLKEEKERRKRVIEVSNFRFGNLIKLLNSCLQLFISIN